MPVETGQVEDGTYALRVRAYAASGTGSLADRLGREEVVGEATRVAVVDNAPPGPVAVTSLGPEGGRLVVRWERYGRPNFQEYRVYEVGPGGRRTLRARLDRPDATSWADSTFLAGEARYAVEVLAADQTALGEPAGRRFEPPAAVEGVPLGTDRIRVTWDATPFPAAFGAYVVQRRGSEYEMPRDVARITDAADTTLIDAVPDRFGAVYTYTVRTEGAGGGAYAGEPLAVPLDAEAAVSAVAGYASGPDVFVGLSPDRQSLVRLDPETFAVTASLPLGAEPYEVAVSPSGQALTLSRYAASRLVEVAPLAVVSEFSLRDVLGPYAYPSDVGQGGPGVLTDGGLYLSSYTEYHSPAAYGGLGVVALDARAGQVAARLDAEGTRPPSFRVDYDPVFLRTASTDGRYIVTSEYPEFVLYERTEAEGFVRLGVAATLNPANDVVFVGDRQLAVTEPGNGRVRVLEVPSLREVSGFAAPVIRNVAYDAASGLLYGSVSTSQANVYLGYDPETGANAFSVQSRRAARLVGGVLWADGTYRRVAPLR